LGVSLPAARAVATKTVAASPASVPIPKFATTLQHALRRTSESKDTSKSMILVPLLNPKFATNPAAMLGELRVRGTGVARMSDPPRNAFSGDDNRAADENATSYRGWYRQNLRRQQGWPGWRGRGSRFRRCPRLLGSRRCRRSWFPTADTARCKIRR